MYQEGQRAYPRETGGVLLGYFSNEGAPVVYAATGPGPDAEHHPSWFVPDHAWQCEQIDLIYNKSNGVWVYLGDWHTHPDGAPAMSWIDHRTLLSIAAHPQALTPEPIMLIGSGGPDNWEWVGHQFKARRWLGLTTPCDKLSNPRIFD